MVSVFSSMSEMSSEEMLARIYHELTELRNEIEELKMAIIPEEEPDEWDLEAIKEGERDISEGKYRKWEDVEKEL